MTKKSKQAQAAVRVLSYPGYEQKLPPYRGKPLLWLEEMALEYGMHPRTAVNSPRIMAESGAVKDRAKFTEEVLKKAVASCIGPAKKQAEKHNALLKAGKAVGYKVINESDWFSYGTPDNPVPAADPMKQVGRPSAPPAFGNGKPQLEDSYIPRQKVPLTAKQLAQAKAIVDAAKSPTASPEAKERPGSTKPLPKADRPAESKRTQKAGPTANGRAAKFSLLGQSATAVLRWMGKAGWKFAEARRCLDGAGLKDLSDATVRAQLADGAGRMQRGDPAKPTKKQIEYLETLSRGKKWPGPAPTVSNEVSPSALVAKRKEKPKPASGKSSSSGAKRAKPTTTSKSPKKKKR